MNRIDFTAVLEVVDSNPNGDPDNGNAPRQDPETGHGLITDVCVKRQIRNFVSMAHEGKKGFDIFMAERSVLNKSIEEVAKGKRDHQAVVEAACAKWFDVRAFGAVLATGEQKGGNNVTGPVQVSFARSVDPIVPQEHCITRVAVTSEEESKKQNGGNRTMGRKWTVPYALYVLHGSISPRQATKTGFSEKDVDVFLEALTKGFEQSKSAGRNQVTVRKLVMFEHESELGSAPIHKLHDLVQVERVDTEKPARRWTDYRITVGKAPEGVKISEPFDL